MQLVLAKHQRRVTLVDDQDAIEEFTPDGAHEASGDGVGPRRPHRRPDDPDIDGGEDGVEARGEFGVAIADEEPEPLTGGVEVHGEVAGLLGQPRAGRVRG